MHCYIIEKEKYVRYYSERFLPVEIFYMVFLGDTSDTQSHSLPFPCTICEQFYINLPLLWLWLNFYLAMGFPSHRTLYDPILVLYYHIVPTFLLLFVIMDPKSVKKKSKCKRLRPLHLDVTRSTRVDGLIDPKSEKKKSSFGAGFLVRSFGFGAENIFLNILLMPVNYTLSSQYLYF